MKIIWHFTYPEALSEEQKDEFTEKIKIFHKESLVIFMNELDIHIINKNENKKKQDENN